MYMISKMNEDGIMLYLRERKGAVGWGWGVVAVQSRPENEQIPNTVFLAAGLLFTPDSLLGMSAG